jgi:hypothetical protein
MATEKNNTTEMKEERVPLTVPRGAANDEHNVFISVNGVGYLLPKGKTSMVPPFVKAEWDRSVAAQNKMDEHRDELLEAANAPLPGTV